jgi:hypothetical protein
METKIKITTVNLKVYSNIPSTLYIEADEDTLAKILLYVSQLKSEEKP